MLSIVSLICPFIEVVTVENLNKIMNPSTGASPGGQAGSGDFPGAQTGRSASIEGQTESSGNLQGCESPEAMRRHLDNFMAGNLNNDVSTKKSPSINFQKAILTGSKTPVRSSDVGKPVGRKYHFDLAHIVFVRNIGLSSYV